MKQKPHADLGFTLVELLVVILIIAVLAALSMTGYVKLRNQGDRATAVSTMRQLQIANTSYASDHNGKYVPLTSKDENNSTVVDWQGSPTEGKSTDGKIAYRHGGKAVVTYYDGSTALVGPAEIRSFDSKGGANHLFWKANH